MAPLLLGIFPPPPPDSKSSTDIVFCGNNLNLISFAFKLDVKKARFNELFLIIPFQSILGKKGTEELETNRRLNSGMNT